MIHYFSVMSFSKRPVTSEISVLYWLQLWLGKLISTNKLPNVSLFYRIKRNRHFSIPSSTKFPLQTCPWNSSVLLYYPSLLSQCTFLDFHGKITAQICQMDLQSKRNCLHKNPTCLHLTKFYFGKLSTTKLNVLMFTQPLTVSLLALSLLSGLKNPTIWSHVRNSAELLELPINYCNLTP